MASVEVFDGILKRVSRTGGKKLFRPQDPETERYLAHLSRENTELREALRQVIEHLRQGPDWDTASVRRFSLRAVDSDPTDHKITVRHGAGYPLLHWSIIRNRNSISDSGTPPLSFGSLRLVEEKENEATFQFDEAGWANKMIVQLLMFRAAHVPIDADGQEDFQFGGYGGPAGIDTLPLPDDTDFLRGERGVSGDAAGVNPDHEHTQFVLSDDPSGQLTYTRSKTAPTPTRVGHLWLEA